MPRESDVGASNPPLIKEESEAERGGRGPAELNKGRKTGKIYFKTNLKDGLDKSLEDL